MLWNVFETGYLRYSGYKQSFPHQPILFLALEVNTIKKNK